MKRGLDDDALSWGDENDPTYVAPDLDEPDDSGDTRAESGDVDVAGSPRSVTAPDPEMLVSNEATVATAGIAQADADEDAAAERELLDAEAAAQPISSAALIAFGIFGGIFFLYTVGWLVGLMRNPPTGDGLGAIVQAI